MPKSARFQTERSQKMAVGVVTLLVAAVALGGAHLYTRSHQMNWKVPLRATAITDLDILAPEGWEQIEITAQESGYADNPTVFRDPAVRGRILTIGRRDVPTPTAPDHVLRALLNERVMKRSRVFVDQGVAQRQRIGSFAVIRYFAHSRIDAETATTSERVIVFTEDGRRHWAITLSAPVTTNESAEQANDAMLSAMIESVSDRNRRDARSDDFAAAMLPPVALAKWRARVEAGPRGVQAITLTPGDGGTAHLATIRLIGELNTTGARIPQIRPGEALARQFEEGLHQSPDPKSLTKSRRGDVGIWRLPFSDEPNVPLKRELIYLELTPQRGALIEVLAENAAWADVQEEIDPLIDRLADALGNEAATGSTDTSALLADAVERGGRLADSQRRAMVDQQSVGRSYWLIRRDHRTLGAQVSQTDHSIDVDFPLVSRRIQYLAGDNQIHKSAATTLASADGATMHSELMHLLQKGGDRRMVAFRVSIEQGKLSMLPYPMVGMPFEGWSVPVPQGFLPSMAEETWNLDEVYNLASAGPVLVWRSRGEAKPEPAWLTVTKVNTEAEISPQTRPKAAVVLTLRPIMTPDADRLWLDENGRVLMSEWNESGGFPFGGVRLTLAPSDEATVVRLFPDSRAIIRQLNEAAKKP
ncbi:MAG: hypothetical protein WD768_02560 [Phycisphaeraceae bacterium]